MGCDLRTEVGRVRPAVLHDDAMAAEEQWIRRRWQAYSGAASARLFTARAAARHRSCCERTVLPPQDIGAPAFVWQCPADGGLPEVAESHTGRLPLG